MAQRVLACFAARSKVASVRRAMDSLRDSSQCCCARFRARRASDGGFGGGSGSPPAAAASAQQNATAVTIRTALSVILFTIPNQPLG